MRRLVVAAVMALIAQNASAADLPILRGSYSERPVVQRPLWEGFYVGGQASMGSADADFTGANKDLIAQMMYGTALENEFRLSEWPLMGPASQKNKGFGGFAGYNLQWDEAVVGVEANYVHGTFGSSSRGEMGRIMTTSTGYTYNVLLTSEAAMKITDMGSLRVRGGYSWNNFLLPYGFIGVGLGIGSYTRTTSIQGVGVNPAAAPGFQNINVSDSLTDSKNNRLIYGYAVGAGLDVMLAGGLFGRLEWEYMKFAAPVETTVNTVRAGLGYKF